MYEIINDIKSKPQFDDFLSNTKKKTDQIKGVSKMFYNTSNSGKYFISLDIKCANFTIIKYNYPKIFEGYNTWTDYISKFTSSDFIKNCKFIRELIFGKLGVSNKISSLCTYFINKISQEIESSFLDKDNINMVNMSADEIVYLLNPISITTKTETFESFKSYILDKYPNMFHVKMFKLHQLGVKQFFVKEYINDMKTIEFKCCPSKFIMQCIRFWQKEKCTLFDLKFIDEGELASYEKSIFGNL